MAGRGAGAPGGADDARAAAQRVRDGLGRSEEHVRPRLARVPAQGGGDLGRLLQTQLRQLSAGQPLAVGVHAALHGHDGQDVRWVQDRQLPQHPPAPG